MSRAGHSASTYLSGRIGAQGKHNIANKDPEKAGNEVPLPEL